MGLRRRLRALDEGFERRVEQAAPDDDAKDRLGLWLGLAVVVIIGAAKAMSSSTPLWAVALTTGLFGLLVYSNVRFLRRYRHRR